MTIKAKSILFITGAIAVTATSFGVTYYYISSNENAAQMKRLVGQECKRFYQQESLTGWANVEAADAWEKDGKIIIELNAKEDPTRSSYIRRLCVIDRDKGSIMIPSLRSEGKWEK